MEPAEEWSFILVHSFFTLRPANSKLIDAMHKGRTRQASSCFNCWVAQSLHRVQIKSETSIGSRHSTSAWTRRKTILATVMRWYPLIVLGFTNSRLYFCQVLCLWCLNCFSGVQDAQSILLESWIITEFYVSTPMRHELCGIFYMEIVEHNVEGKMVWDVFRVDSIQDVAYSDTSEWNAGKCRFNDKRDPLPKLI